MADAIKEIFAKEIEESEKKSRIEDIKQLMQNMKWTAEQAMDALGISLKDQKKYMTLL